MLLGVHCVSRPPKAASQMTESKLSSYDVAVKKCSRRNLCCQHPMWKWLDVSFKGVGRESG